jgi:hypothetical protein
MQFSGIQVRLATGNPYRLQWLGAGGTMARRDHGTRSEKSTGEMKRRKLPLSTSLRGPRALALI